MLFYKMNTVSFLRFQCYCKHAKLLQLCLNLSYHMSYSPLGSSVHGILQAKTLEWVAMPFSRGIFLTEGIKPKCPALAHRFFTI